MGHGEFCTEPSCSLFEKLAVNALDSESWARNLDFPFICRHLISLPEARPQPSPSLDMGGHEN
jgi:hypothetical protein